VGVERREGKVSGELEAAEATSSWTGDGAHGMCKRLPIASLRSRRNALEGRTASRESRFATGGNAANPMVARRVQHPATIEEEQAVEVV
jgi:hypothetical protein